MSPAVPIPFAEPTPLPGPVALFWVLLLLTFTLHTVAMNLLVGGSILSLVWRIRRGGADEGHRAAGIRFFAKAAPTLMAATVTFGVASLLFVQVLYGRLFFTSSILIGVLWLAIVPLAIVVYSSLYALGGAGERPRRGLALAGGTTLLLLVIAFLYTANVALMLRPEEFVARFQADGLGLRPPLGDATLLPRLLHTLLAALAVAAAGLMGLGLFRRSREGAFGEWAVRQGLIWFGWATAANIVVGLWYLAVQPRSTLAFLFSREPTGLALVSLTFLLPLVLVVPVPLALRSEAPGRRVWHLLATLAVTLVLMVLLRDQVRQAALARVGFAQPSWIEPQWVAIGLFLVLLVGGAAVVAWMVRALAKNGRA